MRRVGRKLRPALYPYVTCARCRLATLCLVSTSPALRHGSTTPATRRALFAPLTLGCAALMLAGCSLFPGGVTHYVPEPAVVLQGYDCQVAAPGVSAADLADPASFATGSVPEGFVTAGVVRCRWDFAVPSGPSPTDPASPSSSATAPPGYVVVEEHLGGNFGPLLAALAEPSDRQGGGACPAMAEMVPDVWLVNAAGKAVHVQWPLTVCNFTKPGVRDALVDLSLVSTTTLHFPMPAGPR